MSDVVLCILLISFFLVAFGTSQLIVDRFAVPRKWSFGKTFLIAGVLNSAFWTLSLSAIAMLLIKGV